MPRQTIHSELLKRLSQKRSSSCVVAWDGGLRSSIQTNPTTACRRTRDFARRILIATGKPVVTLPGLRVGRLDFPKFSAEESLLGLSSTKGVIHVWRAPTFEEFEAYESVPGSRDIPLMRRLSK